ncbi:MAG: hypothetical protein ACOCXM_03155 [Myxococcota bacterium]
MGVPSNIDLHLYQTRDGQWRCRMEHAGGGYRTPAHPTAMGATVVALEQLAILAHGLGEASPIFAQAISDDVITVEQADTIEREATEAIQTVHAQVERARLRDGRARGGGSAGAGAAEDGGQRRSGP